MFCDGYYDTTMSFWNTAKMFLGGFTTYSWLPFFGTHVPSYMEKANVDFLKNAMQW
jgi:hypothetical protein